LVQQLEVWLCGCESVILPIIEREGGGPKLLQQLGDVMGEQLRNVCCLQICFQSHVRSADARMYIHATAGPRTWNGIEAEVELGNLHPRGRVIDVDCLGTGSIQSDHIALELVHDEL